MKRIIILVLLLIGLSAAAYYLIRENDQKGMVTADRGFSVPDLNEIKKIVIQQKKMQPIVFTRKGKGWIMNGKYPVDPGVFVNVEKVLTNVTLLYVPPAGHTNTIMESIKENGIQVDLYEDEDAPIKIFHIGTDLQKSAGTHMVMAGSAQPYVMYLPGLEGGLRSRFEQPAKNFRDKFIYQFPRNIIKSIKIEYPKDNFSSFILTKQGDKFELKPVLENIKIPTNPINEIRVNTFIDQFENMGTEGLIDAIPERDSIIKSLPCCILTLTTLEGKTLIHKYFSYDGYETSGINANTPAEIRALNRVFIYTNDDDLYTSQNRVVGDIFHGYSDFFATKQDIIPKNKIK